MIRLVKLAFYAAVLAGVILISVNGYLWYRTGVWGRVTALDLLRYVTGKKVELPGSGLDWLRKRITS